MVGTRNLVWSVLAGWCALFAAVQVGATLQNPTMWILVHHTLKQARIDPIVTPGKPSSHMHSFVGVNGITENTTTAQDLEEASNCTTSGLSIDESAYWAPSLYSYNANNDTFTPRPLGYVNTYYLMRGNVAITAFPKSMQLLAGNAMRTGPGPTKQADNTVSFVCLDYKNGSKQTQTMPQTPCPQGLRTQVVFPSCWNGKDLVSENHTHVVYPMGDNADNGDCPSSHPVRLPTLFYEFVWSVDGQDNQGNSTWVFSNGDSIGYSFHADFIAAWDEQVLQDAIDQCAGNLFNDLEACPPFVPHIDRKGAQNCKTLTDPPLKDAVASLPGCNVVWNGPHAGKGLSKDCDPNKVMLHPANWPPAKDASSGLTNSTGSISGAASTVSSALSSATSKASAAAAGVVTSGNKGGSQNHVVPSTGSKGNNNNSNNNFSAAAIAELNRKKKEAARRKKQEAEARRRKQEAARRRKQAEARRKKQEEERRKKNKRLHHNNHH